MPYYDDPTLKVLENLGLGASDMSSVTLQNTSIQQVKTNIYTLADFDKWHKERDEDPGNLVIQQWIVGGFSVSGYQKVNVVLKQVGEDVEVHVSSKSKGGQIADWGANKYNVERILTYLRNPSAGLTKRKVPGEKRGLLSLMIVIVLAFLLFLIYTTLLD